jgi:hypothetical protein
VNPGLVSDMPFLTDDWLLSPSIAAMTPSEEGGYVRLLCFAWRDPDCCLPDDDASLAGLSRLGPAWGGSSGVKIKRNFQPDPARPGFIFNAKQRQLRVDQMERITSVREQRQKAANSRWHPKRKQCNRIATALQPESGSNASLSQIRSKSERETDRTLSPGGAGAQEKQPGSKMVVSFETIRQHATGTYESKAVEAFIKDSERKGKFHKLLFAGTWRQELEHYAKGME